MNLFIPYWTVDNILNYHKMNLSLSGLQGVYIH